MGGKDRHEFMGRAIPPAAHNPAAGCQAPSHDAVCDDGELQRFLVWLGADGLPHPAIVGERREPILDMLQTEAIGRSKLTGARVSEQKTPSIGIDNCRVRPSPVRPAPGLRCRPFRSELGTIGFRPSSLLGRPLSPQPPGRPAVTTPATRLIVREAGAEPCMGRSVRVEAGADGYR